MHIVVSAKLINMAAVALTAAGVLLGGGNGAAHAASQIVAKVSLSRQTMQVLVDSAPALGRRGGVGRSYADAPEIDGLVHLLPPEKISKTYKVGDFVKARIVGTQGHDLVGVPV